MKRSLLIATLLLFMVVTQAHEFWLRPNKFRYNVGEEMKVDFMVGDDFVGEFWDMNVHKAEKVDVHFPGGVANITAQVKPAKGKNVAYKFLKEGTYMLTLQSNAAFIEQDGATFDAYLEEDGIDNIRKLRTNADRSKPVKEYYQRFAKLLVQAGAKADEMHRKRAGFPVELMPLSNPYTLKSGDYLTCRVICEMKPAKHQLVKVWSHIGNRVFVQNIFTEDDGTITFPISSTGAWMVSTVMMMPSVKEGADYQSMWASLAFGIE